MIKRLLFSLLLSLFLISPVLAADGHRVIEGKTATGTIGTTGALEGATVNTGQGANELYGMNQDVRTTSSPIFVTIDPTGVTDNNIPYVGVAGFANSPLSRTGTNTIFLDDRMDITDGTDTHIIKAVQETGLGGRLTIGLDETARTMVIVDAGDVDTDFGLAAYLYPTLVIDRQASTDRLEINPIGILSTDDLYITSYAPIYIRYDRDIASGNFAMFGSVDGTDELTDTDGEQSGVYIEPKINQTSTAAYNGLHVNVLETTPDSSIGDGSSGQGNNLLLLERESVPYFKVDRDGTTTVVGDHLATSYTADPTSAPSISLTDSDAAAAIPPVMAKIYANLSNTGDGTEVGDIVFEAMSAQGTGGALEEAFRWDSLAESLVLPLKNDPVTPTICFGDCGEGIFQSANDLLDFGIGGTTIVQLNAAGVIGEVASSFAVLNELASSTNPTLVPDRANVDGGIGAIVGSDAISAIAGNVEAQRWTEAARTIEENTTVFQTDGGDVQVKTVATHGLAVDDTVSFADGTGTVSTDITAGTIYYVTQVDSTTLFNISASRGGSNISFDNAGTAFNSYEMEITINLYGPVGQYLEIYGDEPVLRLHDSGATADATAAYLEFGGTDNGTWVRTGYVGDSSGGNTHIHLWAEIGDLHLGDSSGSDVLVLTGGNAFFNGFVYATAFANRTAGDDLLLSPQGTDQTMIEVDFRSSLLIGNKTKLGTWGGDGVSNGTTTITDVGGAAHGLSLAAGDLVNITNTGEAGDIGFYRIVSDDGTLIVVDRALTGSNSDLTVTFYKDVIGLFATDGTNGQRIMNYSHQDKPLQIGGDILAATGHSLGSEDVLIGGKLEVNGTAYFDGSVDMTSNLINNVADATEPTDAANLQTVLEQTGVSLHYYLGNTTLDQTLTESEAAIQETQDADPDLLSNVFFVALEADTPAPFQIDVGAIIPVHFDAKVTTTAGKYDTVLYVKLGYVDDDGSGNFVQIGSDSDSTATLTADQTAYELHVHVSNEITVPVTKRLYLQVWADSSGAGNYAEINFYYDSVPHHVQFAIDASVLENFALKSVVGASIGDGLRLDGTVLKADRFRSTQNHTSTGNITEAHILAAKFQTNNGASGEVDLTLPALSYTVNFTFIVQDAFIPEINPPSGELFDHDGTDLNANEVIDMSIVIGDKLSFTRILLADGSTWRWSTDTIRGVHVRSGASD